jgi:hypothetical protein
VAKRGWPQQPEYWPGTFSVISGSSRTAVAGDAELKLPPCTVMPWLVCTATLASSADPHRAARPALSGLNLCHEGVILISGGLRVHVTSRLGCGEKSLQSSAVGGCYRGVDLLL